MWISILIKIIISFLIIFISHQLWNYLKDNYSTKKTKDLVGYQIQKYKSIMKDIQNVEIDNNPIVSSQIVEYNLSEYNPPNYQDLKNDLEIYLKDIQ